MRGPLSCAIFLEISASGQVWHGHGVARVEFSLRWVAAWLWAVDCGLGGADLPNHPGACAGGARPVRTHSTVPVHLYDRSPSPSLCLPGSPTAWPGKGSLLDKAAGNLDAGDRLGFSRPTWPY